MKQILIPVSAVLALALAACQPAGEELPPTGQAEPAQDASTTAPTADQAGVDPMPPAIDPTLPPPTDPMTPPVDPMMPSPTETADPTLPTETIDDAPTPPPPPAY